MIPDQGKKAFKLNYGFLLRLLLLVFFVSALFAAFKFYDLQLWMLELLSWIEGSGPSGPLVFFLLYILA